MPSRPRYATPVLVLFAGIVILGVTEKFHARLLSWGEGTWNRYAYLRADPIPPECDPNAVPQVKERGPRTEDDDLLDDLFGEDDPEEAARSAREAAEAALAACKKRHQTYQELVDAQTPGLLTYRSFETAVGWVVTTALSYLRHLFVLLLLFGGAVATWTQSHIVIRQPSTRVERRLSLGAQVLAAALLMISSIVKWHIDLTSEAENRYAGIPVMWVVGFAVIGAFAVYRLRKPTSEFTQAPGNIKSLLAVPLFATMAIISGLYFFLIEGHPAGLAIYLQKLSEHAVLYLHVGLYVWAGMLLKQIPITGLGFDILRPWKLPAPLLAFVVVAIAAIPTAYSGASGIFVIAAGGLIYSELRRAGAERSLALATTAMSGSMGVVLSPCLLVVIIAALNKQVTTDQLFHWGFNVYALTAILFLVCVQLFYRTPLKLQPADGALQTSVEGLKKLLPYVAVGVLVVLGFGLVLDTWVDEHTAPTVVPVILVAMLLVAVMTGRNSDKPATKKQLSTHAHDASSEAIGHVGALLLLMGMSVGLGGVVERADVMALFPQAFGSVYVAMTFLLVVLVIIGMTMDPYGAVILVSATIAEVAYNSGINPVHFWMVVLVAFELGYLTPPVALNHLLTRQVVGASEALEDTTGEGPFFQRHARLLLPMSVMAAALLLVAFVPLWVG